MARGAEDRETTENITARIDRSLAEMGSVKINLKDPVNHPPHYTAGPIHSVCGNPIECIEVTRTMGFDLGNAVKYIWRCDLKNDAIEDLEKAMWYLQDEINRRRADQLP